MNLSQTQNQNTSKFLTATNGAKIEEIITNNFHKNKQGHTEIKRKLIRLVSWLGTRKSKTQNMLKPSGL